MVNAVILAGALNDGALSDYEGANEALIKVGEKAIIDYVIEAIRTSERVAAIYVVGQTEFFGHEYRGTIVVEAGESILDNLKLGMKAAGDDLPVLIATADIPFMTAAAVDHFLLEVETQQWALAYTVVDKSTCDREFPNVKRTYIKLRDITVTGGNVFYAEPERFWAMIDKTEEFIALRKDIPGLARKVGLGFLLRYLFKRLTLQDVVKRVKQMLAIEGGVVVSPFAAVGVDVDKPSDLILAQERLGTENRS